MKEKSTPRPAASLPEDMIEGRNAVSEALRSGRSINKVFLANGDTDRALAVWPPWPRSRVPPSPISTAASSTK